MNLRQRASEDMKRQNIKDWGLLIKLRSSDGTLYDTDAETGEPLKTVMTLWDTSRTVPDDGEDQTIETPNVSMALSSLERVPQPGETWVSFVQFEPDGDLVTKEISEIRAPEGGRSVGFIRLYFQELSQS